MIAQSKGLNLLAQIQDDLTTRETDLTYCQRMIAKQGGMNKNMFEKNWRSTHYGVITNPTMH